MDSMQPSPNYFGHLLVNLCGISDMFDAVAAGDMEWLKSIPPSSAGPPPMPMQPQQPMPSDVEEQQRHIQQMLLAMHSMPPPTGSAPRWATPPPVGATAGHVPGMPPRPAPIHPTMAPQTNHIAVDSAVDHQVSLLVLYKH